MHIDPGIKVGRYGRSCGRDVRDVVDAPRVDDISFFFELGKMRFPFGISRLGRFGNIIPDHIHFQKATSGKENYCIGRCESPVRKETYKPQ